MTAVKEIVCAGILAAGMSAAAPRPAEAGGIFLQVDGHGGYGHGGYGHGGYGHGGYGHGGDGHHGRRGH